VSVAAPFFKGWLPHSYSGLGCWLGDREICLIPGSCNRYFSFPNGLECLWGPYQVKCGQEREDNHSPPTSAKVMDVWNSTCTPRHESIVCTEKTLPSFFLQNLSYCVLRYYEGKQSYSRRKTSTASLLHSFMNSAEHPYMSCESHPIAFCKYL